jgi:SAM-dependent methyltransferase
MDIRGWEERYRQTSRAQQDLAVAPTELVVDTARRLPPGRALDLACGAGRNALWLARAGWHVTAVDGSSSAIQALRTEAERHRLPLVAEVADLQSDYVIEEASWDLIVIAYYLQVDLFEKAKKGVAPGGLLLTIVHTTEGDEKPTRSRLRPGELKNYFSGWELLHEYEGMPNDPAHKRRVSEVVTRRPIA